MKIAIDASSGFKKNRTGVEEYTYQILQEFKKIGHKHKFVLYFNNNVDLDLEKESRNWPDNFEFAVARSPRMVINPLLSLELLKNKPDVLWVPAQVMPVLYHPKNTVVTIHGLEYEHFPAGYTKKQRILLRFSSKFATRHAKKIIAVSKYTKNDLAKFYKAKPEKITAIYNGFSVSQIQTNTSTKPFILFIGRLEPRKGIGNLIQAFDIFKDKYKTSHKLYLAGKPSLGYQAFKESMYALKYKDQIKELGFISDSKKQKLVQQAALFVFPSFAEGFGIPLLEAMSVGTPVLSSDRTSLPEVGGDACLYFDVNDKQDMADKMWQILSNSQLTSDLVGRGYKQVKKFSWEKCARKTLTEITECG